MNIRVIKNDKEYKSALAESGRLIALDPEPGTAQADRLDLIAVLVEKYEKEHFPIEKPDPLEAIRFRMEQQGLTQKDLIQYLGSRSKVSEILSGKRRISFPMARALYNGLGIPAEVLLQEQKLQKRKNGVRWRNDE